MVGDSAIYKSFFCGEKEREEEHVSSHSKGKAQGKEKNGKGGPAAKMRVGGTFEGEGGQKRKTLEL